MARVKIPLEVANGFMARNIEELKDNFDIKKIVGYFLDGKLHKWLEDRYYDDELEAIEKLSATDERLADKLCEIFNVEQDTSSIVVDEISKSNEKLGVIREITDDDKLIEQAERIARNQEELDQLVSAGERKIYLLEGTFEINLKYENVKYIGLSSPIAHIPSKKLVPFGKKNIRFENIEFDSKYKELERKNVISNAFVITRDRILYVDSNGKLIFAHVGDLAYNLVKIYNNDVPNVLKDNSSEKRKVSVEKYFEDCSDERIIGVCASGDMYGAISESGNVYTWSNDEKVNKIDGITDIIQMECGLNKFFALDKQGSLIIWDRDGKKDNVSFDGKNIKQISVYFGLALGLDSEGKVFVVASTKDDSRMNIPTELPSIKKIVVGTDAVYALSEDGKVFAWGNKYSCQISDDLPEIRDIGISNECTPVVDVHNKIHLCGRKERSRDYKTRLKEMPKVKSVIGERFAAIWCVSTDNELYRNNRKMKLKRRGQDEFEIKIYNKENV